MLRMLRMLFLKIHSAATNIPKQFNRGKQKFKNPKTRASGMLRMLFKISLTALDMRLAVKISKSKTRPSGMLGMLFLKIHSAATNIP